MRKSNENSLKEAIEHLLDHYRLRDRLNEIRVKAAWESQMGSVISNKTTGLKILNETLHISLSSAPLRKELSFEKEKIIAMMNKELGGDFIKDLVLR